MSNCEHCLKIIYKRPTTKLGVLSEFRTPYCNNEKSEYFQKQIKKKNKACDELSTKFY